MKWTDLIEQHVEARGVDNPSPDAKKLLQLYLCRLLTAPDGHLSFGQKDAVLTGTLLDLSEVRGSEIVEGPSTSAIEKQLNFQLGCLGEEQSTEACAKPAPYPTKEDFRASLRHRQAELEHQLVAVSEAPDLGFNTLLETLETRLNLTPAELKVLTFMILRTQFHWVRNIVTDVNTVDIFHAFRVLAFCLKEPASAISDALGEGNTLAMAGFLANKKKSSQTDIDELVSPGPLLRKLVEAVGNQNGSSESYSEMMFEEICPPAPSSAFSLSSFSGVGDLQLVINYLRNALKKGAKGANVLLYGPPGTGKTELARALAKHIGSPLYEVPTMGEYQTSLTGSERLDSVYLAQSFLQDRSNVILLFDEMEDAFRDHRQLAKGWFNKLLEQNRVPTIWISNRVDHIDAAFLRRFAIVLPVQDNGAARARNVADTLQPLPVSSEWAVALAKKPWMTPALANNLREVGALLPAHQPKRNQQRLQSVLEERLTLARGEPVRVSIAEECPASSGLAFSQKWLNTTPSLRNVERLLRRGQPARLCLYGPPGAGKTAYAAELARRLGRPFTLVSGSDLQSCFVGETEKNIAGIFIEAEHTGAVLLLDEADTFLFSRETAQRSWEVSMTNEFMVRMERFKGIFLATTNRMDSLDSAVMRRFQLKVRFGYLNAVQLKGILAKSVVDPERVAQLPESSLSDFIAVTPGLIQTALNQLELLGLRPKLNRVLKALAEEQALQMGEAGKRVIGFHV